MTAIVIETTNTDVLFRHGSCKYVVATSLIAVALACLSSSTAHAGIIFNGVTGATHGGYSLDPLRSGARQFSSDGDNTTLSATALMPQQTISNGTFNATYASSFTAAVTEINSSSFHFTFSASAATDAYNDGSHYLRTDASSDVYMNFTTDTSITVRLSLQASPALGQNTISGYAQEGSGAQIVIQGNGVSAGLYTDTERTIVTGLPDYNYLRTYSQVNSPLGTYTGAGNKDLIVTLSPGAYQLSGLVESYTQFGASNGYGNTPYGSGAFTDPSIAAVGNSEPSSVPEPSSLALFALGGIGVAVGAYRRRSPPA